MKCDLGPLSCPGGFRVVPFVESISASMSTNSVLFNMTGAARALQLAADREKQCGEGYTGMACRACTERYILASTDEGEKREETNTFPTTTLPPFPCSWFHVVGTCSTTRSALEHTMLYIVQPMTYCVTNIGYPRTLTL